MSRSPSVSIAIRAYRRRWLGEAIASVLSQTYEDLELVVYDDAGDLYDIAAAFTDGRVRYHRAQQRLDPAGRYKAAFNLCRGLYVGLLDDDDRYEPEFVARLVAALETDERIGIVTSRVAWDLGDRVVIPSDPRPTGIQLDAERDIADFRLVIASSTALMRHAAFSQGERSRPMPPGVAPDMFASARAAADGWRIELVDARLVTRRWHDSQLSREVLPTFDRAVETFRYLPVVDPVAQGLRRRQLAFSYLSRAAQRLRTIDRGGARADLARARAADGESGRWTRRALWAAAAWPALGALALRARWTLRVRRRLEMPPGTGPGVGRAAAAVAVGGFTAQALGFCPNATEPELATRVSTHHFGSSSTLWRGRPESRLARTRT